MSEEQQQEQLMVSLDGGETFLVANQGVRVYRKGVCITEEDSGHVEVCFTDEGIITDVNNAYCDNLGTESETYDELVERLVNDPQIA